MKKAKKLGILVFILSLSLSKSFAQTAAGASGSAIAIPANEPRLIIAIADENDFNRTVFDWKIQNLKDAAAGTAMANSIKSKNASVKNISITMDKAKFYSLHLEANAAMEAYQYFQLFVDEGVKYAMINNKAIDLVSYIKRKTSH